MQTFSKAFGLAGLRLGYAIADTAVITDLQRVNSPYGVNSLACIAAKAALKDLDFVDRYSKEVMENRELLEKELNTIGIRTFPSKANFLIADFGEKCGFVFESLKERGILVRDRSDFPLLKNCLRIGIGTKEQCSALISSLRELLQKDAIIFDLDGTLIDVSQSLRRAIQETAEYFTGTKVSQMDIQSLKEKGGYNNDWDVTEAIIRSRDKLASKGEIIRRFQEVYTGNGESIGFMKDERLLLARNSLEQLSRIARLGIVTGRPKKETDLVLKRFGIRQFFDTIICMEDCPLEKGKPDPFGINLALSKLGRKKAIYVGDSVDDIKAARAAGIDAIGVIPPSLGSDSLSQLLIQNGARFVIDDINDILKVVS